VPRSVLTYSETPNPAALRCDLAAPSAGPDAPADPGSSSNPGLPPLAGRPGALRSYRSAQAALAAGDALAAALLAVPGLTGVLLHQHWLTITKDPQSKWPPIKRAVERIVAQAISR